MVWIVSRSSNRNQGLIWRTLLELSSQLLSPQDTGRMWGSYNALATINWLLDILGHQYSLPPSFSHRYRWAQCCVILTALLAVSEWYFDQPTWTNYQRSAKPFDSVRRSPSPPQFGENITTRRQCAELSQYRLFPMHDHLGALRRAFRGSSEFRAWDIYPRSWMWRLGHNYIQVTHSTKIVRLTIIAIKIVL